MRLISVRAPTVAALGPARNVSHVRNMIKKYGEANGDKQSGSQI